MKRLLPILTLMLILICTPLALATTPLGLTQDEVDVLSGYGQDGMANKTVWEMYCKQ
ncbi:MAG: hypothetical protein GX333_06000 [Syntrophomonadaceae bacterium]|nr:hypothetical protein [Syntrophomonadaceae bacterium]